VTSAVEVAVPLHGGPGRSVVVSARRLDAALIAPGPARRLVAVRSGLAALIGLRLLLRRWWTVTDTPSALFEPAFAVRWLAGPPAAAVVVAVQVVGVVAAGLVLIRRRPRVAFVIAWMSLVFLGGVWSAEGKVLHNDVLLLLAAIPFLFAPDPRPATDGEDSDVRWGWPPRAALVIVGSAYAICGLQKLRHSGIAWVTSDNLRWVLWSGANGTRAPFPGFTRSIADNAALCHGLAGGALFVELAAPFLLMSRRTRPVFVGLALALHAGIALTLGLDYWAWVGTVAVVALAGTSRPAGSP
jgi:hypothetical protein